MCKYLCITWYELFILVKEGLRLRRQLYGIRFISRAGHGQWEKTFVDDQNGHNAKSLTRNLTNHFAQFQTITRNLKRFCVKSTSNHIQCCFIQCWCNIEYYPLLSLRVIFLHYAKSFTLRLVIVKKKKFSSKGNVRAYVMDKTCTDSCAAAKAVYQSGFKIKYVTMMR